MTVHGSTVEGWQLEGNSADAYERYLASAFSPWAQALVALADVREGDHVLDVACGTGIVARHAAASAGSTGRVVGVDLNTDMLRVAGTASAGIRPPIEWREGNAIDLPFPDGGFDVVCCEQALQFLTDPARALREMHRVLRPAGRVAVSVCRSLEFCTAYAAMADALDRHVGPDAGTMMRSPFSTWSVGELRVLFSTAGFRDVRVRIEVGSLRYPSVEEFVRREAASSPLAGPIGAAPARAREALVRDLERSLAGHCDDDGVVCVVESCVVVGRREE